MRRKSLLARLRPALLQRVPLGAPAVRSLRIPDDIAVAHAAGAPGGVPGHPTIGQAIEDQHAGPVARRGLRQAFVEIGLRLRRERAIADVRQPKASRNVVAPLLAPDRGGREIWGLRRMRQNVDEEGLLVAPQNECAFRVDDPCARERGGRRRPVIVNAIILRLGRLFRPGNDRRPDRQQRTHTEKEVASRPAHASTALAHHPRKIRRARLRGQAVAILFLASVGLTTDIAAQTPFVQQVAPGVYAHQGLVAQVAPDNRGDIANIGFIVGDEAVAVVDCGGSGAVGEQLLAAVRSVTTKPIRYVVITHVHPDHMFGASAFTASGATFVGHRNLPRALAARGDYYLRSFRSQLGDEVERVKIVVPSLLVEDRATLDLGHRTLELRAWKTAHTDHDLSVFDPASGVLFTGDLVFLQHTPIIDGSLLGFQRVIPELEKIPATRVVPGHGPVGAGWPQALADERRYFDALARDLRQLVKKGADMEQAAASAGQSERGNWALFDAYAPRNATAGFAEIEWE